MNRYRLLVGDVREKLRELPAESVQCVVTSPPYWGLRDYGIAGQLGLERTPAEYVSNMVEVFREVRRVLRDDGTLWLNLGDCYATGAAKVGECPGEGARWRGDAPRGGHEGKHKYLATIGPMTQPNRLPIPGLKPKDLVGIPWRVAFALQADGWWLRCDVIWHKPNPMPSSVRDRPTLSHEYLFLLSKSEIYFYDPDAIREPFATRPEHRAKKHGRSPMRGQEALRPRGNLEDVDDPEERYYSDGGRNKRSVWTVATRPFPGAHFATFPEELVEPCILAGSSAGGACAKCGGPCPRNVQRTSMVVREGPGREGLRRAATTGTKRTACTGTMLSPPTIRTTGWAASCDCAAATVPCTVLDPFAGSGTTGVVALRLGREFVGIDLNPTYAELARGRIQGDAPLLNVDQGAA